MNTETLDRLEALLAKSADGPWHVVLYGDGDSLVVHDAREEYRVCFMATPGSDEGSMEQIEAHAKLIAEMRSVLPALLSIARRAADVEAIRAVTAKASSEWTGPNPAEFATGVAFVTKPHFVATAVSRYVMGETTPVSIADIGDDEEVGR